MMHRNNFDALRLAAAAAVLCSHMFLLSGRNEPMPFAGLSLGTYGVYVFFAISGYLVTLSWLLDSNARRFFLRRMLRIAPAYIVVLMFCEVTLQALGITDFHMNPFRMVNGSLWTIPLEVACYVAFLLLALLTRHGGVALLAVALILPRTHLTTFAIYFAFGSIIAQYRLPLRPLYVACAVAVGAAVAQWVSVRIGTALALAPAVLWVGTSSWPIVRDAGAKGDISYGVYLYAAFVQQIVVMVLPDASLPVLFAATVPAVLVLAVASWLLVERPALSLKPLPAGLGRERSAGRSEVGGPLAHADRDPVRKVAVERRAE